jgi:hypothetical protein
MNILYYDCFAGLSGDMNLAAMIDLGVEPAHLSAELDKLGLSQEFQLVISEEMRNGIRGTRADVNLSAGHDHHHGHGHHRTFADIRKIIMSSGLQDAVKKTSLRIFRRVAEAEAKVHGKAVDEVHFHEVGATDSIVDIVGAAICYHQLDVDAVWAAPVELGGGFVRCAHGEMPVPAPATVEILQNVPTSRGNTDHEATTPTGAAIIAALTDEFITTPTMTVTRTGYGVGHRETTRPNLLRVHLAKVEEQDHSDGSRARLLQCNIDDMTGEALGHAMELLMDEGAMDIHFSPVMMKKNRPATMVSLLCAENEEPRFKELLFRHTTTLGVKSFALDKTALQRRFDTLETPLGPVSMKRTLLDGKVIRSKPEYEDCRELARKHDLPLAEIYAVIGRLE